MNPVIIELLQDGKTHYRAVFDPRKPVTVCEIQAQSEPLISGHWRTEHYGLSVCKQGDIYDMETGLRLALKSALRKPKDWQFAGSKRFRAAAWAAYLERFPVSERNTAAKEAEQYKELIREIGAKLRERMERDMIARCWLSSPFGNASVTWKSPVQS
jgi:hypothetical protein